MAKTGGRGAAAKPRGARPGRPTRADARHRKQLVVDVPLLEQAMRITGQNQSDTVNAALVQLTENAAILDGFERLRGAFPDHPDHTRRR